MSKNQELELKLQEIKRQQETLKKQSEESEKLKQQIVEKADAIANNFYWRPKAKPGTPECQERVDAYNEIDQMMKDLPDGVPDIWHKLYRASHRIVESIEFD